MRPLGFGVVLRCGFESETQLNPIAMSEPEGPGPPKGSSWPSDGGTAPEVHSEATGLNLIGGSRKEHASSVRLGAPNETETGVELIASSPDADLASSTVAWSTVISPPPKMRSF